MSSLPASLRIITIVQEREEFEKKAAQDAPKEWLTKYFEDRLAAETKFLRDKQAEFSKLSSKGSDSNQDLLPIVQAIMNDVFKTLKGEFSSGSFKSEDVLSFARDTIVATTLKYQDDPNIQTIKSVLNETFKQFRKEFEDGKSYTSGDILDKMKSVIVSTTNSLVQTSAAPETPKATTSAPASKPAAASKIISEPSVSPSSLATGSSGPSFLRNLKTKSEPSAAPAPAAPALSPVVSVSPAPTPATPPPTPATPVSPPASPVSTPASPAVALSKAKSAALGPSSPAKAIAEEDRKGSASPGAAKAGVETIRNEAEKRINKNPGSKEVDLTDPEILDSYVKIRNPHDSLLWMVLTYEGQHKLKVAATGSTGFDDFLEEVPEDKPCYMYINYRFGDTERNKNVFMSFVPEAMNGIAKARVVEHRAKIEAFFKYMHITWHCLSFDEISEKELVRKLLSAGGANYSVQEENKGNFKDYKTVTHQFYRQKDSETELSKVVYAEGPLTTTPCDISGRAMVAAQTDFQKNTSEVFRGKTK